MGNNWGIHYIARDLKANKTVNITLFLFVCLSAWLMASGALVIERLTGALDHIEQIAAPPHYLQMHIGDYDEKAIKAFADETGMVEHVAIQKMFNVDGVNIIHETSFSDSLLDNYFVIQNDTFDFLLDSENQIAQVDAGEIGIPVVYAKKYGIEVGERLTVTVGDVEKSFVVKTVIRDAQMGSSLASSIRFLISPVDFQTLYPHATKPEVLIGFRLYDEAQTSAFSDLYNSEQWQMPKNGVGITLPLIKLLNGIGDGLMSGLILLVSVLFMVISVLNIRLVLLSTLEQEAREIGTLRAIGIGQKEVARLYRLKYKALAFVACVVAVAISFLTSGRLLQNISLNFGLGDVTVWTYVVPVMAALLVFVAIQLSVRRILKALGKMHIVSALTEGQVIQEKKRGKRMTFRPFGHRVEWALGLHEYRAHFKSWSLLIVVFFLLTLVILIPLNLYMTMNAKSFAEYVGAAKSDVRIALDQQSGFSGDLKQLENALSSHESVERWALYQTVEMAIQADDGRTSFLVEMGDYQAFPVQMQEGHLPLKNGEIALSVLNATRLNLGMGDTLTLFIKDKAIAYEVVGLYQDITNGGVTSKIAPMSEVLDVKQNVYYVDLSSAVQKSQWVQTWSEQFKFAKVIPVETLIDQTLGTITASLKLSVVTMIFVSCSIAGLISVLAIYLKRIKNRSKDASLMAIGFSARDIRQVYGIQAGVSLFIGTALGAFCSLYFGEGLMSGLLSVMNFGMTQVTFIIQPLPFFGLGVLLPMAVGGVCVWLTMLKTTIRVGGQ